MTSPLVRLYPKLKTWLSLYGKNPSFLAKTFCMSLIIGEIEKVKPLPHMGFSVRVRVARKWIKSSLSGVGAIKGVRFLCLGKVKNLGCLNYPNHSVGKAILASL